jgi:curved DNA-binding protein CbpA
MSVQAVDPYLVLELRRDASSDQIQRAYRKLAMRWFPDRNSTNIDTATERFSNVNESYDVLTNRRLRAILDKQGLVALSNEYTFTKSPQAMFEEFFGTLNPLSVIGRGEIVMVMRAKIFILEKRLKEHTDKMEQMERMMDPKATMDSLDKSAANIRSLEKSVASAAEISVSVNPLLDSLARMENRILELENRPPPQPRPQQDCCVVS